MLKSCGGKGAPAATNGKGAKGKKVIIFYCRRRYEKKLVKDIWVIDQEWSQHRWIFACLHPRSIKTPRITIPISSRLDPASLVNEGFVILETGAPSSD